MKARTILFYVICAASMIGQLAFGQSRAKPTRSTIHYRHSSYWSTKDGFQSTVQLHNNLVNWPVTVTPILYQDDGTATELMPVTLRALGNASIDINTVLAEKGLLLSAQGSLTFRYTGSIANAISAETLIVQSQNTLSYTIPSYERRPSSPNQYFAYWKPAPQSEVYIALQNTSSDVVRVRPGLRIGSQTVTLNEQILGPHQLKTLEIPDDLDAAGRSLWTKSDIGGINLSYDGPEGALNTSAWIEDEELGFSTMLSFHDPAMAATRELLGTQILLGEQKDLTEPGKSLKLSSYLILRNITDKPVNLVGRLLYESSGTQADLALPLAQLAPQEIRNIPLSDLQDYGIIPKDVRNGSVTIKYDADNGAVMGRVFSVSNDRTFAFYTALEPYAVPGVIGVYWTADENWNSILTVTNFSVRADTAKLQLTYTGGSFSLPAFRLAPFQSKTINLKDVVAGGVLATDGRSWPPGITSGGYRLVGHGPGSKLVVKEQTTNSFLKLATPFYALPIEGRVCLSQHPFNLAVGATAQFKVIVFGYDFDDPEGNLSENCPTPADEWSEENYSGGFRDPDATVTLDSENIASLSESESGIWTLTALEVGTATITAESGPWYTYHGDPEAPLPFETLTVEAEVAVVPKILFNGSEITGPTNVIVGQRIHLSYSTGGATVTNQSWSVPGTITGGYSVSIGSGAKSSADLTQASPIFYWVDGGSSRTVTLTITLSDNSISSASATFTVLRPTANLTSTTTTTNPAVNVSNQGFQGDLVTLNFGYNENSGITFHITVTAPTGGAGQVGLMQLINTARTITLDNATSTQGTFTSTGSYVLDDGQGIQYGGAEDFPASQEGTFDRNDSPNGGLTADLKHRSINESFKDYLMYRPAGANSIWVPLRLLSWSWSASASKGTGGSWSLDPGSTHSTNPSSADTTVFPEWSAAVSQLTYQ